MLLLADQFDFTFLKFHAESFLVERFLDPPTAADTVFFADAHSFLLLKEAAMKKHLHPIPPKAVKEHGTGIRD